MHDPAHLATLLQRTAREDRAAFAELYRLTSHHLMGVAYAVLRDRARAEDALQEGYVAVWRYAPSFNPALAAAMTWLITVVRNKARDAARAARVQAPLGEPLPEGPDGEPVEVPGDADWEPDTLMQRQLESLHIARCMEGLKDGPRQAVALVYFRGLVHTEVAADLGVPLGTAKAWVRRGLVRLRDCLESAGVRAA